ncbi:MAG: hypothetical protein WA005_19035 [Candidatus Binataceae bacterium]
MSKTVNAKDFRAVRQILTADDFADVPADPTDPDELRDRLVDQGVWHSLQDLPDTVSIFTSGLHGPELALQDEFHNEWIKTTAYDENDNLLSDVVREVAFDAETEWQAAIFSALHGYYRQAIGTLRNGLEGCVVAARYQADSSDPFYLEWSKGNRRTVFANLCEQIANRAGKAMNSALQAKGLRAFIDQSKTPSWVYALYEQLCNPAHSRPGYTHADYWSGSNGPIYERESFLRFHVLFLETLSAGWLLCKMVRPTLRIPPKMTAMINARKFGDEAKEICDILN